MESYFRERSQLFNAGSTIPCSDSCERFGCREMDLHISVSLIDLLALAWAGGRPAADLFIRDCKVAFDPSEEDPCFGRLTLELIKPCHFLDGKRCRDYPGRPIACALFPESRFVTGEVDLKAVVGEVLEGATLSAEGIVRLPLQRLEMLLWERFSRGGYIDEWKTKIERLDEAELGPLEGVKRTIDQTASVTQGSPVRMAYPFDGNKLMSIRLKRDR